MWILWVIFGIFCVVCLIYKASGGQESSQSRKQLEQMGAIQSARLIDKYYHKEWKCEVGVFKIVTADGSSSTLTVPVGSKKYQECLAKSE